MSEVGPPKLNKVDYMGYWQ